MNTERQFQGYPLPTSNTTYTPNQFFDVVLRYGSRGAVRLVAYMIRKTLGWSDAHGNPQEPRVHFSYRQLEQHAGIGHSTVRRAIDEALAARYIRCIQPGTANTPGTPGTPAIYELNWDESDEYITDPERFNGFFAGNGNLTYIPNDFFDYTVPNEPLAVVRVVGAIIRHTIGFQTRYGFRRQKVAMSVTEIQRKTGIVGRQHVLHALQQAIERNHIVRMEMGLFDPEAGKESQPAIYGIRWLESGPETDRKNSSQNSGAQSSNTPKRLRRQSSDTPKRLPGERSEKVTGIEITPGNNTLLDNNSDRATPADRCCAVVAHMSTLPIVAPEQLCALLQLIGFNERTARQLVENHPQEVIRRQIEWLPARNPGRNPLGMLRCAIEGNWDPPVGALQASPAHRFATHFYAGWAGSTELSAAPPSSGDVAAA
ncbi:MAG: hypothetical protein NZ557_16190, partial [Chthonomonadaceae bacterium]|nr:hypothetical protein [Chthonomonadaceae bacterium]